MKVAPPGVTSVYRVSETESMTRYSRFKAPILSTLIVSSLLGFIGLSSQRLWPIATAEGLWGISQDSAVYQRLPNIENQLYGHAYPDQPAGQRISRMEKSLFGGIVQGPLNARLQRIEQQLQEQKAKASQSAQEPMIAYLEDKLFQQSFPEKTLTERVRQLETQVFGRSFDNYPLSIRIKKLTYAMPLVAKEVRLTKGDVVIASANRMPQKTYHSRPAVETVQLDAIQPAPAPSLALAKPAVRGGTEDNIKVSTGDYFSGIHRLANGSTMRWAKLPIRVYIKSNGPEGTLSQQALKSWENVFSVEPTLSAPQADIIISWDKADWDQNPSTLLTRPVLRMNDNSAIRTIVLITMYPIRGQSQNQILHVVSHQLGHAFGLWGHSNDPDDVMYPAFKREASDFPTRWRWRSVDPDLMNPPNEANGYQPSQRDINTLLRVYNQPANDLSAYSAY